MTNRIKKKIRKRNCFLSELLQKCTNAEKRVKEEEMGCLVFGKGLGK
jgi:hypothetical protein